MQQLIYRGHTYDYIPVAPRSYQKPHALNWRYQVPGEQYSQQAIATSYHKPQAINWRYQMALGE